MTCPACGAAVRPDAAWCGQCHAPLQPASPAPTEVPGRTEPVPDPLRPAATYSRWRGGDTSMGPFGRIAWTLVMVGFGVLFLFTWNPFTIAPWWLIAMPLVLRSVWARKRIT